MANCPTAVAGATTRALNTEFGGPVIHDATTVTFTRLRRGAVIHLRALLPSDVARVQAIVADRLAALAER